MGIDGQLQTKRNTIYKNGKVIEDEATTAYGTAAHEGDNFLDVVTKDDD